jgi:hypothetical protein
MLRGYKGKNRDGEINSPLQTLRPMPIQRMRRCVGARSPVMRRGVRVERCRALPAQNVGSPRKPGQSPALQGYDRPSEQASSVSTGWSYDPRRHSASEGNSKNRTLCKLRKECCTRHSRRPNGECDGRSSRNRLATRLQIKYHIDFRFNQNWPPIQKSGFVLPLLDCIHRRLNQQGMTRDGLQFDDVTLLVD